MSDTAHTGATHESVALAPGGRAASTPVPSPEPHDTDICLDGLAEFFDRLLSADASSCPSIGGPTMSTRFTPDETDSVFALAERVVFDAVERGDRQTRKWLARFIGDDMAWLEVALARAGRDTPAEQWVKRYLRSDEPLQVTRRR